MVGHLGPPNIFLKIVITNNAIINALLNTDFVYILNYILRITW